MRENEMVWSFRQDITLFKLARVLGCVLLIAAGAPENLCQTGKNERITFVYYERLIYLPTEVNGHGNLLFLLDTGASASAIDLKTAQKLKMPFTGNSKVEGTAGVIDVKNVRIKSIAIGNARAEDLTIPAYDLSGLLTPPGTRVDGIVGNDFLGHFVARIDFLNRTARFSRNNYEPTSNELSVLFSLDNYIPRVRGLINDTVAVDLRLDTGASLFETSDIYLNVTEDVWNKLTVSDPELKPRRYFTGSGVGGQIKLPVAQVKNFSLAMITVPSPFLIVQPKQGYFARPDAVGFISNNFLEKFSPVTISYPQNKLYLTRN